MNNWIRKRVGGILPKTLLTKFRIKYELEISHRISFGMGFLKIALLGVSGVGKSTLFDKLVKVRNSKDKWMTEREYLRLNTEEFNISSFELNYNSLLNIGMNQLRHVDLNAPRKIEVLYNNLIVAKRDSLINQIPYEAKVIIPDGLLHILTDQLIDLHNLNYTNFKLLTKDHVVIYCTASPELIAHRIINRLHMKNGWIGPFHRGLNKNQIIEWCQYELKKKENLIKLLETSGIQCLHLNTSDSIEYNVSAVRNFLKNINIGHYQSNGMM